MFAVVGPALVPLNSSFGTRRRQPERRDGARSVRRRDVVLRVRAPAGRRRPWPWSRICCPSGGSNDGARGNGEDAGSATPVLRGVERLRGAALRALHRRRSARHPGRHLRRVRAPRHQRRGGRAAAALPEGSPAVRGDPRSVFVSSAQSGDDRDRRASISTSSRRSRCRFCADIMTEQAKHSQVVEAEGHLIDSQLLNVIFDTVIKWDASFEVLQFTIGRTNEEASSISMRIASRIRRRASARARRTGAAGVPDCAVQRMRCSSPPSGTAACRTISTRRRTCGRDVRHGGRWIEVDQQRMDAVMVIEDGTRDLPEAAGREGGRRRRLRRRRRPGGSRISGARSPGICVHDERDLVGAARRSGRRADRGDDGRRERKAADRLRSWPVPCSCTPAGRRTLAN